MVAAPLAKSFNKTSRLQMRDAAVMSKMPLSGLLQRLPEQEFIRIHRSNIISINRVERFSATDVVVYLLAKNTRKW